MKRVKPALEYVLDSSVEVFCGWRGRLWDSDRVIGVVTRRTMGR